MSYRMFIEVGPLQEIQFTGISNVTRGLCDYWLRHDAERTRFFLGPYLIRHDVVAEVVKTSSGGLFQMLLRSGDAGDGFVENDLAGHSPGLPSVAIFPNVKSTTLRFDYTFQIIHDLSFLLTPEFHHPDTVQYHSRTIRRDLKTNTHTFCVSRATASDLVTYLNQRQEDLTVCYPGADYSPGIDELLHNESRGVPARPFVVVPGTIEPRKNIDLVLAALNHNPGLMRRHQFVFVGGSGWLINFRRKVEQYNLLRFLNDGKIVWLNYVDEAQKVMLYRKADFVIYPSYFEGFGMPVAEAMFCGCPVVCSYSSSIPEAGGAAAIYFDPSGIENFESALFAMITQIRIKRGALSAKCRNHARTFTWERFNTGIKDKIDSIVTATGGAARR